MESNESIEYHEYLIRLDDELSQKLVHFSKTNDMTLTGTIRRSLRQFFKNEEYIEPAMMVKNDDHLNEDRDK